VNPTGDLRKLLLLVVVALGLLGTAMLYSAGQTDATSAAEGIWVRQLIWLTLASIAGALAYRTSFRLVEWAAPWLYGLGLLLLAVLLVAGTGAGTASGTKSWLALGGVRLGQPVELAKLATILMLARWFAARREPPATLRGLIPPIMIAAAPALLVLMQPDFGSGMVFVGILFATLFWAGVRPSLLVFLASPVISLLLAWNTVLWSIWMVALFVMLMVWRPFLLESVLIYVANSAAGVLAIVVWNRIGDFQRARILTFINPESDPLNRGYHAIQSKIAIGSGGLFGAGFTDGPQKRSGFIPEHWTDFVFSVVGEELGFVGVVLALGLLFGLLMVMVQVARRAADPYASLVVFGVVGLLFTHIFENVGMTISLMPITGIPLPFFSYGGSFTLAIGMAIGLAMRAAGEGRSAGYVDT
jgi:rod shape determining protein RodA